MAFQFPNSPTVGQQTENTASGQTFTWNGTSWDTTPVTSSQSITSSFTVTSSYSQTAFLAQNSYRDYTPITTVEEQSWQTTINATQITNWGFTAVGGATIAQYVNYYGGQYMLILDCTQPTTTTATYTVPTAYLRHEIDITPGTDNMYYLQSLADRNANTVEIWVCDPSSGVPQKRLTARGSWLGVSSVVNYRSKTTTIGPRGQVSGLNENWQWYNWNLPKFIIDTYKTSGNKIKLAIRPGFSHPETNIVYIGGFGTSTDPYMIGAVDFAGGLERLCNNSPTLTSTGFNYGGNYQQRYYSEISANETNSVLVPIPDETRTYYLGIMGLAGDNHGQNYTQQLSWSLIGPSSTGILGQIKNIVPPIAEGTINNSFGYNVMGWVITPSFYTQYLQNPSNTSAFRYLKLQAYNQINGQNQFLSGIVLEAV